MTDQQPMKMAAAEALWETTDRASFSLLTIGDEQAFESRYEIAIPGGLSLLAENDVNARVEGIRDLQAQAVAEHGEGDYVPIVWLAYWTFRLMIGFGIVSMLLAGLVLVQIWRGRLPESHRLLRLSCWGALLPLGANAAGWIFTETARQPWLVFGILKTEDGISPGVSVTEVAGNAGRLDADLRPARVRGRAPVPAHRPSGPLSPSSDADPWLSPVPSTATDPDGRAASPFSSTDRGAP
jgi:cytochrome d ubiquinol oxidase subunit I